MLQPFSLLVSEQQELLIGRRIKIERDVIVGQSFFQKFGHGNGMFSNFKIEVVCK